MFPADEVQLSFDSRQREPHSPQQTFDDLDVTPEREGLLKHETII